MVDMLLDMPFEMLFLRDYGLVSTSYFGHFWYLSAMIIALSVYGWLACSAPRFFHGVVLPLSPILYGSMILNVLDGMGHWAFGMNGFISHILRGFAGIGLGWFINDCLKKWNFEPTQLTRWLLTIIEVFALALALYLSWNYAYSSYDIHIIACFAVMLAISTSGKSFTGNIQNRFLRFLGQLSLPIYVCHVWIEEIVHNIYLDIYPGEGQYVLEVSISILVSIIVGAVLLIFTNHWWPKLKSLVVSLLTMSE